MGGERTAPSLAKSRRYLANLSDARWAESVREHEGFMAALGRRGAELFASLLQDHSHHTGEVVCRRLRERATLGPSG